MRKWKSVDDKAYKEDSDVIVKMVCGLTTIAHKAEKDWFDYKGDKMWGLHKVVGWMQMPKKAREDDL